MRNWLSRKADPSVAESVLREVWDRQFHHLWVEDGQIKLLLLGAIELAEPISLRHPNTRSFVNELDQVATKLHRRATALLVPPAGTTETEGRAGE